MHAYVVSGPNKIDSYSDVHLNKTQMAYSLVVWL
jgi:hypothetical protein